MKNAEIVRKLPKLGQKKRQRAAIKKQIRRLLVEDDRIGDEISVLGSVTHVIDGVAVAQRVSRGRYGRGMTIATVDDESLDRNAEVYPNTQNGGKTFGLRTRKGYAREDEYWSGADWTWKAACAAAIAWVVEGFRPRGPH